MKVIIQLIFLVSILVIFIVCNNVGRTDSLLLDRCNYYDSIGHIYLEGFAVHKIRNSAESSYEVNRIGNVNDRAVIRILPKVFIERNFAYLDAISTEFVLHYAYMGCENFYSDSVFTRCTLHSKDSIFVIFKGNPPNELRARSIDRTKAKKVTSAWYYISFAKK